MSSTAGKLSYKYRSGAAALRSLSDGCLYFAPPAVLNDALEARFDLVKPSRYGVPIEKAVRLLASRRGHRGNGSLLDASIKEVGSQNPADAAWFQSGVKSVGIFSSSRTPDNQPMWAYYCHDGSGVCFELEWSDKVLESNHLYPVYVHYTDKTREHSIAEDFAHVLLEVGDENPHWSLKQIEAFVLTTSFRDRWRMRSVARAVSTKHSDWSHERELRILAPQAMGLPLVSQTLKRVFFWRTEFDEWSPIILLLHRLYPSVEMAQFTFVHREPFVELRSTSTKLIPLEHGADPWRLRGDG